VLRGEATETGHHSAGLRRAAPGNPEDTFRISQLFEATTVLKLANQLPSSCQLRPRIDLRTSSFPLPTFPKAGPGQVDVGEEQRHGAALGDLLGFRQVLLGEVVLAADEVVQRGGQQATWKYSTSFLRRGGR
jgi:hypothetical protein